MTNELIAIILIVILGVGEFALGFAAGNIHASLKSLPHYRQPTPKRSTK